MADPFASFGDSPSAPARRCFAITPDDDNPVDPMPKAIRAVGAGTITLRAADSDVDVEHPVLDGERIDVRIAYIRATGTTGVTGIIGYA